MIVLKSMLVVVLFHAVCVMNLCADEPDALRERVQQSIERGLPLVIDAARRYPEHRQCFACHHQTLPILAVQQVSDAGFQTDENFIDQQWAFAKRSLDEHLEKHEQGERIPGTSATATFGLWTAWLSGAGESETAAKLREYLAGQQHQEGWWKPPSDRPPSGGNRLTLTVIAVELFPIGGSRTKAEQWIEAQQPASHLERVALLEYWSRKTETDSEDKQRALLETVLSTQSAEGGWAELPEGNSDVFTTATTLLALLEVPGTTVQEESIERAVQFLVEAQQADGSWFVKKRARAVQRYFDNGDPHGVDQFISTSASCLAIAALAKWSAIAD